MADRIHPAAASPSAPILEESKRLNGAYVQGGHKTSSDYPPPPAAYRPPRRSRRCLGPCCCFKWLCSLLVLIIILLGITVLVFWLVLRPIKAPEYSVQDVSIRQLDVSNGTLSSVIDFTVRAWNPNKKIGIYYDRVNIFLHYDGIRVGESVIDPFYQGHRNVTFLRSDLRADSLAISPELASQLREDITNERVPFQIRVRVKARVKIGALKSPRVKVRSNCNIHVSPPNAPGGAGLLDKRCKLKVRL